MKYTKGVSSEMRGDCGMESSCVCGVGGRFCGEGVSSSKVGMACCMKPRVSLWMGVVAQI